MKQTIKVALLGYGTVGQGVEQLLTNHEDKLSTVAGVNLTIARILVRDVSKYAHEKHALLTTDIDEVLSDESIDIVVEVMGSPEIAHNYIAQALRCGKHVVTANKDVMARYGDELLQLAHEQGCDLFYEASVAGGVPILRTIATSFASDHIRQLVGIVNGTTNFILSKMTAEGWTYADSLRLAQEKGYAESNPTNDVDGFDAAYKMLILSRLAFGVSLSCEDIHIAGIRDITPVDIQLANRLGKVIKLLGIAQEHHGKIAISVEPTLVSKTQPLANVQDENNAIEITSDAVGKTMFFGPGAGGLPTANAIVSDILQVVSNMQRGATSSRLLAQPHAYLTEQESEVTSPYYFRMQMNDQPGVFLKMTQLFAKYDISLSTVIQELEHDAHQAMVVVITHRITRSTYQALCRELRTIDEIHLAVSMGVLEPPATTG